MKKKINEVISITTKQLANPEIQKNLTTGPLAKTQVNISDKKDSNSTPLSMGSAMVEENDDVINPEAVITPQDKETIKYLSNVIDSKTGEISQPFTIGAQKYQMVRGMCSDNQIVMAVFAHDETDDNGVNIIHSVEDFEKNIAIPCLQNEHEASNKMVEELTKSANETYAEHKHFLVNKETNEVRKFKTTKDLVSAGKSDEEEYMGLKDFKQYIHGKLFRKPEQINEFTNQSPNLNSKLPTNLAGQKQGTPTQGDTKLMGQNLKKDVTNYGKQSSAKLKNATARINTAPEKAQSIIKYALDTGVPSMFLGKILKSIRNISKTGNANGTPTADTIGTDTTVTNAIPPTPTNTAPLTEKKIITKNQLVESLKTKKVIKTIKIKDIK